MEGEGMEELSSDAEVLEFEEDERLDSWVSSKVLFGDMKVM